VCKDPHTQPNLLFVATQKKREREREREEKEEEQSSRLSIRVSAVIYNIWLVGY
jgi:hypothetical protein